MREYTGALVDCAEPDVPGDGHSAQPTKVRSEFLMDASSLCYLPPHCSNLTCVHSSVLSTPILRTCRLQHLVENGPHPPAGETGAKYIIREACSMYSTMLLRTCHEPCTCDMVVHRSRCVLECVTLQ